MLLEVRLCKYFIINNFYFLDYEVYIKGDCLSEYIGLEKDKERNNCSFFFFFKVNNLLYICILIYLIFKLFFFVVIEIVYIYVCMLLRNINII